MPKLTEQQKQGIIKSLIDLSQNGQGAGSYLLQKLSSEFGEISRLSDDPIRKLYPTEIPEELKSVEIKRDEKQLISDLFDFVVVDGQIKKQGDAIQKIKTYIQSAVMSGTITEEKQAQVRIDSFFSYICDALRGELEENHAITRECVTKRIPHTLKNIIKAFEAADRLKKLSGDISEIIDAHTRKLESFKEMLSREAALDSPDLFRKISQNPEALDTLHESVTDGLTKLPTEFNKAVDTVLHDNRKPVSKQHRHRDWFRSLRTPISPSALSLSLPSSRSSSPLPTREISPRGGFFPRLPSSPSSASLGSPTAFSSPESSGSSGVSGSSGLSPGPIDEAEGGSKTPRKGFE